MNRIVLGFFLTCHCLIYVSVVVCHDPVVLSCVDVLMCCVIDDTYLPQYEMAFRKVEQGGGAASAVMCSYAGRNGIPSCANNHLLNGKHKGNHGTCSTQRMWGLACLPFPSLPFPSLLFSSLLFSSPSAFLSPSLPTTLFIIFLFLLLLRLPEHISNDLQTVKGQTSKKDSDRAKLIEDLETERRKASELAGQLHTLQSLFQVLTKDSLFSSIYRLSIFSRSLFMFLLCRSRLPPPPSLSSIPFSLLSLTPFFCAHARTYDESVMT